MENLKFASLHYRITLGFQSRNTYFLKIRIENLFIKIITKVFLKDF